MKCNNCGFENTNEGEFCGNCGNRLIINKELNDNNRQFQNLKPLKRKDIKKIFVMLGILLGITITIVLIINQLNKFKDPFDDIDDLNIVDITSSKKGFDESNSFTKKIEEDYKNGVLSKDEYIMQLAYSIYDTSKINNKYKLSKLNFNEPTELFEKFEGMINELSDDTIKYIFEKYTLSNVKWNVEKKSKTTATSNDLLNGIFDYKVKALDSKDADVSKLDHVKLSSNGNFLIYYTKEGINAITDSDAEKISKFLEAAVSGYKSKYNLDFKYDAQLSESVLGTVNEVISFGLFSQSTTKASQLLKNNNIDTKYLKTAMPVYIIDTDVENTSALGYYVAPIGGFAETILRVYNIFGNNGVKVDNMLTTYSFPFFVVSSSLNDFDDTKIVLAHELFHHYQKYICGNGNYGECPSGNFTTETTANQAAIQVVDVNKTGTVINNHAGGYINDIESSMDQIGYKYNGDSGLGYGAFVFATNYANMVSGGANHMFNSMKTTEALKYIYDNSNGKYKDVLLSTAEKNLTLNYSNKLLIANSDGVLLYPPNHKDIGKINIKQNETINYSSMHYYYITPRDYGTKSQISFNSSSDNLTLLLFVQENNSYKYLYTYDLNQEFVINIDDFSNYKEVVFTIVDSSISGTDTYSYELDNNGTKRQTVTAKSLKLETLEDKINDFSSFDCYYIEDDDDVYRTVSQIKLDFNKNDKISDMYFKGTIQMKNYNPDDPSFAIAQKIVSSLLYVTKHTYEEQFKHFKVIIQEGTDKYSVTFKITKNYYKALSNSLELNAETKYDIVKAIQAKGYICQY